MFCKNYSADKNYMYKTIEIELLRNHVTMIGVSILVGNSQFIKCLSLAWSDQFIKIDIHWTHQFRLLLRTVRELEHSLLFCSVLFDIYYFYYFTSSVSGTRSKSPSLYYIELEARVSLAGLTVVHKRIMIQNDLVVFTNLSPRLRNKMKLYIQSTKFFN